MGGWLDLCIIWEESGQGGGRWVCGSSVLHPGAEYIHPAGDMQSYKARSWPPLPVLLRPVVHLPHPPCSLPRCRVGPSGRL